MAQLDDLLGMLGQYGEQDKKEANRQALMALGFGLMGGRKGQEFSTLGRAGLGAMDQRSMAMANAQAQRQGQFQNALAMLKFQQAQQQARAQEAQAREMAGAFAGGPQLQNMGAGGPTPANAEAVAGPSLIEQYRKASVVAAKSGNSEAAKRFADIANGMEAEFSTTPQTLKEPGGDLASVLIGKRGETKKLPYLPAEKLHFANTGGLAGVGLNPFTGKPESSGLPMTVSPDSLLSAETTRRGQDLVNARAREATAASVGAGQIVETPQGFVRVGKDNRVTPIMAGEGQLQPKPTGAVQQQIASNAVTLGKIDRALVAVKANPGAFGAMNYAPDALRQRTNPEGVPARAIIADIAGQKIHDRSGAAVTVGEAERLRPYIPNNTDAPEAITKKLQLFKAEYQAMQRELQGGRPLAAVASGGSGASGGWSAVEIK